MSKRFRAVAAALVVAPLLSLSQGYAARGSPYGSIHAARSPVAHPSGSSVARWDEVVTGTGDGLGWHIYVASSSDGWRWHWLASLRPGGGDESWVGQQCLTGDGRFVIAVVAPWHANNSGAGMDQGGTAYAVDVRTGVVRPLSSGVSLAYFDPGCGTRDRVALTSYLRPDESSTRVAVLDSSSGALLQTAVVNEELTSAVPVGNAIVGASGGRLVQVNARGREAVLARVPGQVLDVHPDAAGGADFLVARGQTATVWQFAGTRARPVGAGRLSQVRLFAGHAGHNMVYGAVTAASADLKSIRPNLRWAPDAVSLSGRTAVLYRAARPGHRARTQPELLNASTGALITAALPRPASRIAGAAPRLNLAKSAVSYRAAAPAVNTTTPTCAVPRNDLWNQVPQPNSAQVAWAVQQAVRGWLTAGNIPARPATPQAYMIGDSQPLPQFYPRQDFPPPAIAGSPAAVVPPQVMYGILAQESNWNQASWHALAGYGGNPLIANYYGSTNPADPADINYDNADCGYGIAQITDLMRAGAANINTQTAIAVDYAENIAAGVANLIGKWNQLATIGVTMNNGDPADIENWYAAIWAYNSGVHLTANGDPANGLGWLNNPANPIYPANRHPFLCADPSCTSYSDASHPQDWPYQEKVFGWIEAGQFDPNNPSGFRFPPLGSVQAIPPPTTFCAQGVNACDPSKFGTSDPCPSENSSCWWDSSATWANCPGQCTPGTFTITDPAAPEPAATARQPPCADLGGLPLAYTHIVDDTATSQNQQLLHPNVVGCPVTNAAWSHGGSFELDNASGAPLTNSDVAAIDVHQLGAGFAGHTWFTHTRPASDAARASMGRWTPNITSTGLYEIRAFIPTPGATTTDATYVIHGVGGSYGRTIDQNSYSNQWVSLGFFPLQPGSSVTLSSITPANDPSQGADIAFDAMAFIAVQPGSYVALGDSYSSGEGSGGPWDEGTNVQARNGAPADDLCHRSPNAYSRQYAALTQTFANTPVVQLACSGATLNDLAHITYTIAGDGTVSYSGPPSPAPPIDPGRFGEPGSQVDLLRLVPDPKLVTLTIGGNDAGFAGIIQNCAENFFFGLGGCHASYINPDGSDRVANTISGLYAPITDAIKAVVAAVPAGTKVVVLTYPDIFPPQGNGLCDLIYPADATWLSGLAHQMDQVLIAAALSAGASYLDEEAAFQGHELCTPQNWVKPPDNPLQSDPSLKDNYYHPLTPGYAREAQDLKTYLTGIP